MFRGFFLCLVQLTTLIYTRDYSTDNIINENLRRRNVIPLNYINNPYGNGRRLYNEENVYYRKTKNIRQNLPIDRRFELSELQGRDAKLPDNLDALEELQNGLRWIPVAYDQQPNMVYVGI